MAPDNIKPTSIRLPDDLVTQLDEIAKTLGTSRGWLIEQAAKLYIERRNAMPTVDWTVCDEAGSCGFGYRLDLHFSIPSMANCDQVAYAFRDDIIGRITAAGARDVWTDMQGVRVLEWEGDRFEEVTTREISPEEILSNSCDTTEKDSDEATGGCASCGCKPLELVAGTLRQWDPPPQTVNNYYTIDLAALDTETIITEIKRRDASVGSKRS